MVTLSVICIILGLSVVGLVMYIRVVLQKLLYVSETIGDFLVTIDNYAGHLESVYSMETFYGDETLESLLKHTAEMIKEIEKFDSIYSLTTELEDEQEEELLEDTDDLEEEGVYSAEA